MPPSIAGLAVLFGFGLLCWAVYEPAKSLWYSFTKTHGPHPHADGGDAPGKPGAGGGDAGAPDKPAPGTGDASGVPDKLGPGGHEYALPEQRELARSITDSLGVGQPPAELHPEIVTRQVYPAELAWKPPSVPVYPDGHYLLQDDGAVDPLIIKQVIRLLNDGLPLDPSREGATLSGIYRVHYNKAGVVVEKARPDGLFEQTFLPKELFSDYWERYIPPGANWYEYSQELFPSFEPLQQLTTWEIFAASVAVVFLPGAPALLYRAWIGRSEYFRMRFRSRIVEKAKDFSLDYLAIH